MACELWRSKIDAYVDGELPATEMSAFDAHLASCTSCAADALGRLQWKRATHLAGRRFSASAEFRERIAKRVGTRKKTWWRAGWMPRLVATAAIVIVIIATANLWLTSSRKELLGELADLHVATLASPNPVDVLSSDRHTVKPWFAGKIPFSFNLPELQNSAFTLIGGRVTYLGQSPGAHLLFQIRQHKISVFIFQDQPSVSRSFMSGQLQTKQLSFTVETWSDSGLRYFVISDVAGEDVLQLSELFKRSARP